MRQGDTRLDLVRVPGSSGQPSPVKPRHKRRRQGTCARCWAERWGPGRAGAPAGCLVVVRVEAASRVCSGPGPGQQALQAQRGEMGACRQFGSAASARKNGNGKKCGGFRGSAPAGTRQWPVQPEGPTSPRFQPSAAEQSTSERPRRKTGSGSPSQSPDTVWKPRREGGGAVGGCM